MSLSNIYSAGSGIQAELYLVDFCIYGYTVRYTAYYCKGNLQIAFTARKHQTKTVQIAAVLYLIITGYVMTLKISHTQEKHQTAD